MYIPLLNTSRVATKDYRDSERIAKSTKSRSVSLILPLLLHSDNSSKKCWWKDTPELTGKKLENPPPHFTALSLLVYRLAINPTIRVVIPQSLRIFITIYNAPNQMLS